MRSPPNTTQNLDILFSQFSQKVNCFSFTSEIADRLGVCFLHIVNVVIFDHLSLFSNNGILSEESRKIKLEMRINQTF